MLEIIAVTPEEARLAEQTGAGRIELVSALQDGGLTPDVALLRQTVRAVQIPVNVMIRPHAHGFYYTPEELAVMQAGILTAREAGANGVVFGVLDVKGAVNVQALEALLKHTGELEVTFHRAVDETRDLLEAVHVLSRYPAVRTILTSGGSGRIDDHGAILARMCEVSGQIRIMAGGGLNLANVVRIAKEAGLREFHFGTAVRKGQIASGAMDPGKLAALVDLLQGEGIPTRL
jgi:copper homeostasis protein